jgi:hypothetical protein
MQVWTFFQQAGEKRSLKKASLVSVYPELDSIPTGL